MITASGPDENGMPTIIRVSGPRDPDDPEGYLTESYWLHRLHLAMMQDQEGEYYAYYRDRAIEEHESKDDTL